MSECKCKEKFECCPFCGGDYDRSPEVQQLIKVVERVANAIGCIKTRTTLEAEKQLKQALAWIKERSDMKHIIGIILLAIFIYGGYLIYANFNWQMLAGILMMVSTSILGKAVEG
jgi:hypothetical protein